MKSFQQWDQNQVLAMELTSWPLRPDAEFMQKLDPSDSSADEWTQPVRFEDWVMEKKQAIRRNYLGATNALDFFTALGADLIKAKQDIPSFPLDFSVLYPSARAMSDSDLHQGCPISRGTQRAICALPRLARMKPREVFHPTVAGTVDDAGSALLSLIDFVSDPNAQLPGPSSFQIPQDLHAPPGNGRKGRRA